MNKLMAVGIGLMGCIWLLMGCAQVVVPGAMAGGGEYFRYTTSNVSKETLMGDVRDVTAATRSALKVMGIRLHSVTPYTDETVMLASTSELDIAIKIVPISASTTKVVVDANEDHIVKKDKATADEILSQIRTALVRNDSPPEVFSKIFVKTIVACRFTLPSVFWAAKMNRNTGKREAGFPWMPVKRNTLRIHTTAIFIFMLKHACRIKCIGAEKAFTGLRASVSVFLKRTLAVTRRTLPNLLVVNKVRFNITSPHEKC